MQCVSTDILSLSNSQYCKAELMKSILFLVVMLSSLSGYAKEEAVTPYRQFHGEGSHQCWSPGNVGYWCKVSGVGYTDCNQAFALLKAQNCCNQFMINGHPENGVSIDFKLTKCTNIFIENE